MKKLLTSLALVLSFGWSVFAAVPPIYRQPWTTNRIPHDATATNVTIWTSNGPGELIRGDGGSAFLELATARVHRDVDDEFLTLLGGTAKSTASFVEIYGQDHPTGLGGTTISLHHRQDEPTLPGGAFRIRSAPTNSTTSALRFDLAGQTGNILHYPIWTNQSLVYTGLFMNVNIDTIVAAGSKLLDLATNSKSLFVVDDDARVGINTNNPAANLSIYASSATAALKIDSAHQANILTVLTNGNVGVGTASPGNSLTIAREAGDADLSLLRADSNIGVDELLGRIFFSGSDPSGENVGAAIYGYAEGSWASGDYPSNLRFLTAPAGGTVLERMRITSAGNVGIGTNAPQTSLHIANANAAIRLSKTGGSSEEWGIAITTTGDAGLGFYNYSDTVYRMIIDEAGQVGIGTNAPQEALHIANQFCYIQLSDTVGDEFRIGNNDGKFIILNDTDNRVDVTVDGTGNVGIGTNAPQARLHIAGGDAGDIFFDNAADITWKDTGGAARQCLTLHSDNNFYVDNASAGDIFLRSDGASPTLVLKASGNVGIGTNAPQSLLHLFGDTGIRITRANRNQWSLAIGDTGDPGFHIYDATAAEFRLRIDEAGQVGIGTNAPQATLHTHGTLLVQNCVSNSIGYNCSASGIGSTVGGGTNNTASGNSSSVPGGRSGLANKYGQVAYASGRFSAQGDAQRSDLTARIQTTDATANVEMFLDGASQRCTISSGKSWFYTVRIIAKQSGVANDAAYEFKGVIRNQGGTTTLNQYSKTIIWEDATHSVGWDSQVTADDANDALKLDATGPAGTNVYWVGHIQLVEVQY